MTRLVHHEISRYLEASVSRGDELEDLIDKVFCLFQCIIKSGEPVYKEEALYEVEICPGVTLCDLIYGSTDSGLSRDCLYAFRSMIDQSPIINTEDLGKATLIGTIGVIPGESEFDLDLEGDWISFVRRDLVQNHKSLENFYADFSIAFPRLKFSNKFPQCMDTFAGGHSGYAGVITRSLSSLNDDWTGFVAGDLPATLREFSTSSRCPTSLEGNGDRKDALTFPFSTISERSEFILCEPHMKLESSDAVGDTEYYYHRIYFSPRFHNGFGEKILVGHAGKHL
ncbi:hypothetical protein [Pseudomonas sp. NPDC089406]|uniref:hypothetical protein n=1 Tax=Pseudomonas sp. NPDC089406 TaxID=3364463 RepID=UPI00384AB01A